MKIKIDKCWLVSADDYHEFQSAQNYYHDMGITTDYEEIGLYGGHYVAVFWIGKHTKEVGKKIDYLNRLIAEEYEQGVYDEI